MTASMVGTPYGFNRIQAWFARLIAANGRLPSDRRAANHPDHRLPAGRARIRQGQAFGDAEEAPSLTAAASDGDGNMRSGRRNARGAGRTKEWNDKGRQKRRDAPLTTKAPYKPDGQPIESSQLGRNSGRTMARSWTSLAVPLSVHSDQPRPRPKQANACFIPLALIAPEPHDAYRLPR